MSTSSMKPSGSTSSTSTSLFTSQVARTGSSTNLHSRFNDRHPGGDSSKARRLPPLERSASSTSSSHSSSTAKSRTRKVMTTMTYNPASHVFPGRPIATARSPTHHLQQPQDPHSAHSHPHSQSHSRQGSDSISIHSFASMSTSSVHRSYTLPPGLAPARESEDDDSDLANSSTAGRSRNGAGTHPEKVESIEAFVSAVFPSKPSQSNINLPRSARVEHGTSIPAAAQWLLTTPPPGPTPRTRVFDATPHSSIPHHGSSLSSSSSSLRRQASTASIPEGNESTTSLSSSNRGLSWGKKSLQHVFGLSHGPKRQNSMSSLSRPEPKVVTLQLTKPSSRRSGRLDASTPPHEVPRSWDGWVKRYANGEMDIEKPPPPPPSTAYVFPSTNSPASKRTPYDDQKLSAPLPPLEQVRQKMISRLELFGPSGESSSRLSPSVTSPLVASSAASFTTGGTRESSLFDRRTSVASTAHSSVYASSSKHGVQQMPPSSAFHSKPSAASSLTFVNHPSLHSILARTSQIFDVKVVLVAILLDDKQHFLAVSGLPDGIESLPRDVTFCAHTILNGERGLVVLDTQRDWRFRNNVLSISVNARLYAGMPIYPPSNAELEEEAGGRLPIGTLCILDDKPRTNFSQSERAQLRALASDVSIELEAWVSDLRSSVSSCSPSVPESPSTRQKQVIFNEAETTAAYLDWSESKTPLASTLSDMPTAPSAKAFVSSAPTSHPNSSTLKSSQKMLSDTQLITAGAEQYASRTLPPTPEEASILPSARRTRSVAIRPPKPTIPSRDPRRMTSSPTLKSSEPTSSSSSRSNSPTIIRQTFPSAKTRPPPRTPHQKLMDAATRSLGEDLGLTLVYLVSLSNLNDHDGPRYLQLLSAHNLPATTPSFDSVLHLKALRAVEGGLLYRNPAIAALAPNDMFEGPGFASGILLPVAEKNGTGWVLAGYTKDAKRVFSEEELDYFVEISAQLAKVVAGRSEGDKSSSDAE